jgi:hypothetical protein
VVAQVAVGLVMEVLEVVIGIGLRIHMAGHVAHVALLASIPGRRQIQPHEWIAAGPVQPWRIEQQGSWVKPLFRLLPVALLELLRRPTQFLNQPFAHRLHGGCAAWGQGPHQPGGDLLVGEAEQCLALLECLVGQLGELIGHLGRSGCPHFSRSVAQA